MRLILGASRSVWGTAESCSFMRQMRFTLVAGYRQSNALLRHFRPWLSHQPESELGRL